VTPIVCDSCAEWNTEHQPFRIFGNTYYVGPEGLSSVLITSTAGHVLIDGALPQSAPLIAAHIAALGFRIEDVRWIVSSHAHFDHAGGIALLQRQSRAKVATSVLGAQVLRTGTISTDDPQAGFGAEMHFPPVTEVTELPDGGAVSVGPLRITVHYTPGHTPGATSYSWQSCEGSRCVQLVYADSLNAVSAPGYRFSDHPSYLAAFRRSIAKVRSLPCDILIAAHPDFSGLFERQAARAKRTDRDPDPMVNQRACATYASDAQARLEKRLAEERRPPRPSAPRR
jgi:metallo-beta-lactamase class B